MIPQFKEFNVKSILALYIIVFCTMAMVFVKLDQMVLGALISFIGFPLGYFFGSSKGSEAKDQTIKDMSKKALADEITPLPPPIIGGRPDER